MTGRLLPRTDLTDAQRAAMLALMQEHFVGVTAELFGRDLAEKNWVILLEDEQGQVLGFSTLLVYETQFDGEQLHVVYSGDTIVDQQAWGSSALARTWIKSVNQLREQNGTGERWFWLLITSGFRTYRFLPVFWQEFFPRWNAPRVPAMLEALARERFGDAYKEGIVRFARPQVLRGELCEIPAGRANDPHVAFFAARNSGWRRGDELVCLCELSEANLTTAGRRMVAASKRSEDAVFPAAI